MPAKMRSSGCCLPACLTSSNGWALHQEHVLGSPMGWGSNNHTIGHNFGMEMPRDEGVAMG
eukprot:827163-Pelagomonas_calceolata.AAC.4